MIKNIWFIVLIILLPPINPGFAQSAETASPCGAAEYRQFDFWLGDWVVYVNGQMIGFNKITKIEGDCILRENWKSVVSTHTGTSYNFFDRNSRKWRHIWIDNQGTSYDISGEYRERKMVMVSEESRDDKGNRVINRMTWFNNPDGTVRQLWEQSKDGGMAYTVQFDGLYRKRKTP